MEDLIKALQIFLKYNNLEHPTYCNEETLYIDGITEEEVSEEAYELLCKIGIKPAEYRDSQYNTVEEFLESEDYKRGVKTKEWFLARNFGGTLYLIDELLIYGLVESDCDSWHLTYNITYFGKEIIKFN